MPRGDIRLFGCAGCGFAWNAAFDPSLVRYGAGYEGTQTASGTFNAHLARQIERLRNRLNLPAAAAVLELGAGQGEFLTAMAHLAGASGTGYDPAYREKPEHPLVRIVPDAFPESVDKPFDLFACRMTLEHLTMPAALLEQVAGLAPGSDAGAFVTVPDATRIWSEGAFWDIYYEHVNYFTPHALRVLLERAGFRDIEIETGFGGHYIEATARFPRTPAALDAPQPGGIPAPSFSSAGTRLDAAVQSFRDAFAARPPGAAKLVLWGGGSKAVAFLAAVPEATGHVTIVDINPARSGGYLPGSAGRVTAPHDIAGDCPPLVIVMNENYLAEVRRHLDEIGLDAPAVAVNDPAAPTRIRSARRGRE